jgi:hypothetical protein
MKKILIGLVGGLLVLMGLFFILIPGPSLLFIVPGLLILSFEFPIAKVWLRKSMKLMRRTAQWIDRKLLARKYS